jgi:hypothetical protein
MEINTINNPPKVFNRSQYMVSSIRQQIKSKIEDDRKMFPADQLIYDKLNFYQDDFMTRLFTTKMRFEYFLFPEVIEYTLPDMICSVVAIKKPVGIEIFFSDVTGEERFFTVDKCNPYDEVILTAAIKPIDNVISAVCEPIIQKEFDPLLVMAVLSEYPKWFPSFEAVEYRVQEKIMTLDGNSVRPKSYLNRRIF